MAKRRQQNPGKDFVKKKRKVGKAKIAPSSATKTAFVSCGIAVPTQLVVKSEHVPTTKRKLSFTELLSQLNHHNASFRHDSLTGLRELFTSHPVVLTTNLSVLLEKISPIFTDSSSAVRQALLLLLKHIMENVNNNSLVIFFPRLVTCVLCAMTHIDNAIQLDSLKYLQLFLANSSELLVKNAPQLPNFYLSLLTSQSSVIDITKTEGKVVTTKFGGTSKLVPMKTRLEIFTQLSLLLKASIDHGTVNKNDSVSDSSVSDSSTQARVPSIDVANRKENNLDHSSQFLDLSKSIPSVKLIRSWGACPPVNTLIKDCTVKNVQDHRYLFSCFAAKLLPILFECWMESGPIHMLSGSFTSTELDIKLAVMKLLLYIVQLAYVYSGESGMSQLRNLYSNQFQKCFLTYFPFNNLLKSECLLVLNLYLCEITIILYGDTSKLSGNFTTLMLNFFSETLPHEFHLLADNPSVIAECMLCFTRCLRSVALFSKENHALATMLKGGIGIYSNCHIQSQAKKYLIKIFYEILVVKEKMGKTNESDLISTILAPWLYKLPELLKNLGCTNLETSSLTFDVLVHAAARNMLSMVDEQAELLLSDPLFISAFPEELQRKAISLVWYLPLLNSKTLKLITRLILWDSLKLGVAVYLMQIINQRLVMEYLRAKCDSESCILDSADKCPLHITSLYLSFFWNIVTLGNNERGLNEINSSTYIFMDKIPSGAADKIQHMCKCLLASDFSDQVWDLLSGKMACLLHHKCILMSMAVGVLWFIIEINKALPLMESSSFHSVVTLVLRLVIYVYTEETDETLLLQEIIINLLHNVENLLPALLHNIIADLQINENGELLSAVLIKLLKETKLAHLFYKHRGILTSVVTKCNAVQWKKCDLFKEVTKLYEKQ